MRRCIPLFLTGCIAAVALLSSAQYYKQDFRAITVREGLPSNKVNSIVRDSLGFYWFGTSLGLVRYDGLHLEVFTQSGNDAVSLPAADIRNMFVDRNNLLWVVTHEGTLFTFDHRRPYADQFETIFLSPDSQGHQQVRVIVDHGFDEIIAVNRDWTIHAISRINRSIRRLDFNGPAQPAGTPSCGISAYGMLWVGSSHGMYMLDIHRLQLTEIVLDTLLTAGERARPEIIALETFGSASLLIGGWRIRARSFYGLIEYNTASRSARRIDGPVGDTYTIGDYATEIIHRMYAGEYILHAAYRGPYYYNFAAGKGDTIVHDRFGLNRLNTVSINCWFSEPDGRLISGTNQGVFIYEPAEHLFEEFYPYHKLNRFPNQLSGIHYDDRTGELIIAADDRLFRYHITGDTTLAEMTLPRITDLDIGRLTPHIIPITDDSLLVLSNQVFVINLRTWQYDVITMPEDAAGENAHFHRWIAHTHPHVAMMQDFYFIKDGHLIHMTRAGLRMRRLPLVDTEGNPLFPVVRGMAFDSKGHLWIATNSSYLYKAALGDSAVAQTFMLLNSHETTIRDLWIDADDDLWVPTSRHGLVRARMSGDSLQYTIFGSDHGLLTPNIFQVIGDDYDRLWMSTAYGISCFDKSAGTFRNYGKQHGINFPHNMRTGKGRDVEGRLYLSQGIAITRFDPADFLRKEAPPPVYIKEFRILDSIVCAFWQDTAITLSWRQNNFSFRIASVSHTHSFMNSYEYMLENYHRDWVRTGPDQLLINFNNLRGGKYTFKARAANHEGTWNDKGISVAIAVIPPFWETWWFGLAMAVALMGTAFLIFYLRVQQIRRRELILIRKEVEIQTAERKRIARDLHDDIGAQLSTVNMYLEAMHKDSSASPEAQSLGTEAQQLIRSTIADMSQIITELSPQSLATYGYVAAVHEFLYHIRKSTDVDIEYDLSRFTSHLGPYGEAALFRITQELFNNTIKHAGAHKITFSVSDEHGKATLIYTDDGKGFDIEQVTRGRGLHNIESRVKLLSGRMQVTGSPGHGVRYLIEFPNR